MRARDSRALSYRTKLGVTYGIAWLRWRHDPMIRTPQHFWWHVWLPEWHEGRGIYISVGLGLIAVYRGY